MPEADAYCAAARKVASAFGLDPVTVEVISHTENVVCRLGLDDGSSVVMRLHRPGYNTLEEMESEFLWVTALANAGLPVPTAVPTLAGPPFVPVEIAEEGGERLVGVVEWVDGSPLGGPVDGADGDVVHQLRTLGELMAKIRVHDDHWDPPAGFVRRRWDADGLVGDGPVGDGPLWGRFWEAAGLTEQQRGLFGEAADRLRSELSSLSVDGDRFGLIHADLHLGNLMAAGDDDLTLIDFDDCGFGWFAHEIAVALHPLMHEPWFDQAKQELLDGYRSVHDIDDEEVASIDTFLVVRSLMIVGWLDARRELDVYQYFPDLVSAAEAAARGYLG